MQKNNMEKWYERYESQRWYKNTFLVNNFRQISRATKGDREWNNIEDSGCNFVCLSMIIGINPAYLSSKLKELRFFERDDSLKSKKLNGDYTHLVWDRNKPDKKDKIVSLKKVYHPRRGIIDLSIQFIGIKKTNKIDCAKRLIAENKEKGYHIICGYDDHSRLVAGKSNGKYFLWDPDLNDTDLQKNIRGQYTLEWFYKLYSNKKEFANKEAEYLIYSVIFK